MHLYSTDNPIFRRLFNIMKKVVNYDKNDIRNNIHLTSIISNYIINDNKRRTEKGFLYECCPFCVKKNHFSIDTRNNLYKSFAGCCRGGDIISFIMEIDGLDFKESINVLGDRFNIKKTSLEFDSLIKRENEILNILNNYREYKAQKQINKFFDFVKFMQYEEIFQKALSLSGDDRLLHYIYNLQSMGIYS
jgi:DNA primase